MLRKKIQNPYKMSQEMQYRNINLSPCQPIQIDQFKAYIRPRSHLQS